MGFEIGGLAMAKKLRGFVTVEDIRDLAEGQHADRASQGLYLQIRRSDVGEVTGASWLFRYKPRGIGAKTSRVLGLGPFDRSNPKASLESARRRAADLRDTIARGEDPAEKRNKEREEAARKTKLSERPTFLQYATEYVKRREPGWKNASHRQQWYNTLGIPGAGKRRMAYCDSIHSIKVDKIDTAAVRRVLDPIWVRRVESAQRLRGRIEAILDAARAEGYRDASDNPASWKHLKALGYEPKGKLREVEHHPSMPWKDVPGFVAGLRAKQGVAARCVELVILTAVRSVEARKACWSEIDWEAKRWTVPGGRLGRMKKSRSHAVPLSEPALALLKEMKKTRLADSDFIFPGAVRGSSISDTSMRNTLRDLGIGRDDASIHGFRASFRTWAGEATNYPRDAAEHAIAHSLPALDAAYFRSDLYGKRIDMMAEWGAYCSSAAVKAKRARKPKSTSTAPSLQAA
jgi:integrase